MFGSCPSAGVFLVFLRSTVPQDLAQPRLPQGRRELLCGFGLAPTVDIQGPGGLVIELLSGYSSLEMLTFRPPKRPVGYNHAIRLSKLSVLCGKIRVRLARSSPYSFYTFSALCQEWKRLAVALPQIFPASSAHHSPVLYLS
jgi:hypothetical protein